MTRTVRGRMPSSALAMVDLPAPLSPTRPRTSPRSSVSDDVAQDRRAAIAVGDGVQAGDGKKWPGHRRITGSSARRRPSPSWLKASTVAKSSDQRRDQHPPAFIDDLPSLGDHAAPGRRVRGDRQTDEGKDRLDDDGDAHFQADEGDQHRRDVGQDFAE